MKLRNYALMAEIVGAFGIVLSLVFVEIQIKDNSDILAAQAVFDLRESNSLMVRDLISDPEFSDVIYRGYYDYESLSELENWRFAFWVTEVLTHRMTDGSTKWRDCLTPKKSRHGKTPPVASWRFDVPAWFGIEGDPGCALIFGHLWSKPAR